MPPASSRAPGEPEVAVSPRSRRHARDLVTRRGAALLVAAVVAAGVGTGGGAVLAHQPDSPVGRWLSVGNHLGAAAAGASASSTDQTASAPPAQRTRTRPPSPQVSEAPAPDPDQTAADVIAAVNAQRGAAGLPPLEVSACATEQVTERVAGLAATNAFKHPPLEPVLGVCALTGAAENLAKGYTEGNGVVDGWMDSESHRDNVLGEWTEIGVSCQVRLDEEWLCGAMFTHE